MCKERDIIIVDEYLKEGTPISRHSFVILSTENGEIRGLPYDMICNVLSSFKDEEQRKRKMRYPGNFPIDNSNTSMMRGNTKDGYIKSEQFFYFKKDSISYEVIGEITEPTYEKLLEHIGNLDEINHIIDNLE